MTTPLYKQIEDALECCVKQNIYHVSSKNRTNKDLLIGENKGNPLCRFTYLSQRGMKAQDTLTALRDAKPDTKELGEAINAYSNDETYSKKQDKIYADIITKSARSHLEFWGTDDA